MIEVTREEKWGEKKFAKEITWVIKQLMARDVDPTPDAIFEFCRDHPADVKMISRLRTQGMEPFLRIYLLLQGRLRERLRSTIPPKGVVLDPGTGRPFE